MSCDCAKRFSVRLLRPEDYRPFKRLYDVGRHPVFIGRRTFGLYALNGGALMYEADGVGIAASLVNPHLGILVALNVHPDHRGHGLGSAIVKFLVPNFARVLEDRIPFFEKLGYVRVGALKRGQRFNTQVMARAALFTLAGRLQSALGAAPKFGPTK